MTLQCGHRRLFRLPPTQGDEVYCPTCEAASRRVVDYTYGEVTLLRCLRDGMQDKQIARHLGISPNTVRTRLMILFRKTGTHSRLECVLRGMSDGVLELPRRQ